MVINMIYLDLLYPTRELREEKRINKTVSNNLTLDLQLQEFICSDIMSKKEFDQLCSEIDYLPVDEQIIKYRQEVLQDFINNPRFIKHLMEVCEKLTYKPPERKYNIYSQPVALHDKLKDYIDLVKNNFKILFESYLTPEKELKSEVMIKLLQFLSDPRHKTNAKEIINQITATLDAQAVEYSLKFTYGQSMSHVQIVNLKSDNVVPMKDGKGWRKNKIIDTEHYVDASVNWILENNLNDIYQNTLLKLCDYMQRLNNRIVLTFKQLYQDSTYYNIGVNLYRLCCNYQLPVCKPAILQSHENKIEAKELYSLYLTVQLHKQEEQERIKGIQSNNYTNNQGKIVIITGVNSGGKTIFLQSVGLAQLFTQLGFFVPATSYTSSIAQYIGTLYAMSEDIHTVHGKLEQELVSIRQLTQQIKKHSLILINEILASTSEEDGTVIAADVIKALAHTNSHILFVTHLYDLAVMADNGELPLPEGITVINYITERLADDDGELHGTYHIIPGQPLKDIWEKNLIEKYMPVSKYSY